MNNKQIKVFEELLKDPDFKGTSDLRHLLWRNTTTPKYSEGECFKVTDYGHRIFGNEVCNFPAKVVKSYSHRDTDTWLYELEGVAKCDGREVKYSVFLKEYEINERNRVNDNVITLSRPKDKYPESLDVSI